MIHQRNILEEMGLQQRDPTTLHVDNSGAVDIAHDPMHRGRSMHIERRHLKIRECVSNGVVAVHKIHTDKNLADLFTKALNPRRFRLLRDMMMSPPSGGVCSFVDT